MAAISVTAANVMCKSGATTCTVGTAGEALTAGQVVFLHTDAKYYALSATSDGSMSGKTVGINMGIVDAVDEKCLVITQNGAEIDLGATVTEGTWYVAGGADGVLEEFSDLTATENVTFIGYGSPDSHLLLEITTNGDVK